MRKVIIIGNGFDLDHNLPTNYAHFRVYLMNKITNHLIDCGICASGVILSNQDIEQFSYDRNGEGFPEINENHNGSYCYDEVDGLLFLFTLINKSKIMLNWSDFEDALSKLVLSDFIDITDITTTDEEGDVSPWESDTISEVYKQKISSYLSLLTSEFSNWVELLDSTCVTIKPAIAELLCQSTVFSYNYTKTIELIYNKTDIVHLHGVQGEQQLIYGHNHPINNEDDLYYHNFMPKGVEEELLKLFKKDTQKVLDQYAQVIQEAFVCAEKIYFFGTSLQNGDVTYWDYVWTLYDSSDQTVLIHDYKQEEVLKTTKILRDAGFLGKIMKFKIDNENVIEY